MSDLQDPFTGNARSMTCGELSREAFYRQRRFKVPSDVSDAERGAVLSDAVLVAMARGPVVLEFSARQLVVLDKRAYDLMVEREA